jgi:transcriptional regulator with XRE-family HTH domain
MDETQANNDRFDPAARLKGTRLNMGLSTREAAGRIGIAEHTLTAFESGSEVLRVSTLKKIADFYGLQVTDLVPPNGKAA